MIHSNLKNKHQGHSEITEVIEPCVEPLIVHLKLAIKTGLANIEPHSIKSINLFLTLKIAVITSAT